MNTDRRSGALHRDRSRCIASLLQAAVLFIATPAWAQPPVVIEDAWVRAAPPGATMQAGYLTVRNATGSAVRIVGVESPQFARVEMHESMLHDGVAHMQPVAAIEVPPRGSVSLAPGGLHLMLMEPLQVFADGDKVILTLDFADGWSVEFDATVRREAP